MSVQDATLNLATLLKFDPELGEEVRGEGEFIPSAELQGADGLRVTSPLNWQLTVRASGGDDYILSGSVSGSVTQECRRCLTDVETPVRSSLIYPMVYRPRKGGEVLKLLEDDDEDDTLVFSQPEVDFAPLLTQVFAIETPLTVLCKDDCRGLSLDGVNLNDYPEHAAPVQPERSVPSPFASLKDIDL